MLLLRSPCPHYADNLCRSLRDARTHMSCFRVRIYERGAYIRSRTTFRLKYGREQSASYTNSTRYCPMMNDRLSYCPSARLTRREINIEG